MQSCNTIGIAKKYETKQARHHRDIEAEHPVCPACRSNFRPRKWLKPIARYLRLNRFDQRIVSFVISDRGILTFDFHTRHIHLMQFPLS